MGYNLQCLFEETDCLFVVASLRVLSAAFIQCQPFLNAFCLCLWKIDCRYPISNGDFKGSGKEPQGFLDLDFSQLR